MSVDCMFAGPRSHLFRRATMKLKLENKIWKLEEILYFLSEIEIRILILIKESFEKERKWENEENRHSVV